MGRKPSVHLSLPPRLRARKQKSGRVFYYYDTGSRPRREIPLGDDRIEAIRKWAEFEGTDRPLMFPDLVREYEKHELPQKKAKTQREYRLSIKRLLAFFGGSNPAPIAEIEPNHVYAYRDQHLAHPVQAGRDKSALSAICSFARRKGYLRGPNPCAGVAFEGSKAQRSVYVSDAVVALVYAAGDDALRDAMDIAYLTGQRPQDVLAIDEFAIKDGTMVFVPQKVVGRGGHPVRANITGRLEQVIARCQERKKSEKVWVSALLTNGSGKALTRTMLRQRFDTARKSAAKANPKLAAEIMQFQFRDLRAKAGTDKSEQQGTVAAQRLLGHSKASTTDIYIRSRGVKVEPNK